MMIITFTIALLLPFIFVIPVLYQNNWQPVNEESFESQRLLAEGLIAPIELHVKAREKALEDFSGSLLGHLNNPKDVPSLLKHYVENAKDIVSLSLITIKDSSIVTVTNSSFKSPNTAKQSIDDSKLAYVISENKYRLYDKENSITPAFKSSFSSQPVVILRQHLLDKNQQKQGTLLFELDLNYIQDLCSRIRFGDDGQCIVLDSKTQVVAANNKSWVSSLQEFSSEELVREFNQSKFGTVEYFSKLYNKELIAGYVKVDMLDWTVLVLRPKKELQGITHGIVKTLALWWFIGVLASLLIVWRMSNVIVRPLQNLVTKSKELNLRSGSFALGEVPKNSPIEISVLWDAISNLIKNFQDADEKANALAKNSAHDVRKIVVDFRIKNLQKKENIDPLLGVTTPQCFEQELGRALIVNKNLNVGIILFDIDNLQQLVSVWGKEVSIKMMRHVGQTLKSHTRGSDMVARYNLKSARLIVYINYLDDDVNLDNIAEKLSSLLEDTPLLEKGESVTPKISMGAVTHRVTNISTTELLMRDVTQVLNEFKRSKKDN